MRGTGVFTGEKKKFKVKKAVFFKWEKGGGPHAGGAEKGGEIAKKKEVIKKK